VEHVMSLEPPRKPRRMGADGKPLPKYRQDSGQRTILGKGDIDDMPEPCAKCGKTRCACLPHPYPPCPKCGADASYKCVCPKPAKAAAAAGPSDFGFEEPDAGRNFDASEAD